MILTSGREKEGIVEDAHGENGWMVVLGEGMVRVNAKAKKEERMQESRIRPDIRHNGSLLQTSMHEQGDAQGDHVISGITMWAILCLSKDYFASMGEYKDGSSPCERDGGWENGDRGNLFKDRKGCNWPSMDLLLIGQELPAFLCQHQAIQVDSHFMVILCGCGSHNIHVKG